MTVKIIYSAYLFGLRLTPFLKRLTAMSSRTMTKAEKATKRTATRVVLIAEEPSNKQKIHYALFYL